MYTLVAACTMQSVQQHEHIVTPTCPPLSCYITRSAPCTCSNPKCCSSRRHASALQAEHPPGRLELCRSDLVWGTCMTCDDILHWEACPPLSPLVVLCLPALDMPLVQGFKVPVPSSCRLCLPAFCPSFCCLWAALLPLLSSWLQALYVSTNGKALIQVNPQVRLPRTFKRFCGLMVQLLQKLSIRATNGPDKLLKVWTPAAPCSAGCSWTCAACPAKCHQSSGQPSGRVTCSRCVNRWLCAALVGAILCWSWPA